MVADKVEKLKGKVGEIFLISRQNPGETYEGSQEAQLGESGRNIHVGLEKEHVHEKEYLNEDCSGQEYPEMKGKASSNHRLLKRNDITT